MDLITFKENFDLKLNKIIDKKISYSDCYIKSPDIKEYIMYIKDFVGGGGKRIRPYLCYLSYSAFGGEDIKSIMEFGAGLEFWHGFALIHDDIMDKADKRRNISTVHKFIEEKTTQHIGLSQGMLVGDLLFAWANEMIFKNYGFSNQNEIGGFFNEMCIQTIFGQMIDINLTLCQNSDFEGISQKNFLKTSNYSFIKPMQMGAILAGAPKNVLEQLQNLGTYLGQAFQVRDDLKDIVLDTKNSSKSRFNDIKEGAQTIFTDYIFTHGTQEEQNFLGKCLGKELNEQKIQTLQEIFEKSGAINYGYELISKNLEISQEILEKINFKKMGFKIFYKKIIDMIGNIG